MKIHKLLAKRISYDSAKKRNLNDIKYIVIHYTGNISDTAANNALYFATSNTREAGAHFFVGKKGVVYKSINMNRTAWAVGGKYSLVNGAGSYYGKCTNYNSVSIELCDCVTGYSKKQAKATKKLIKRIRKKCPNAKTIIRHWDVNGKQCPAPMAGKDNAMWKKFKKAIS
ncbi:MAG: N-acetylmuramoyl-L-alanine amidase family protein [Eubacterium sp.]